MVSTSSKTNFVWGSVNKVQNFQNFKFLKYDKVIYLERHFWNIVGNKKEGNHLKLEACREPSSFLFLFIWLENIFYWPKMFLCKNNCDIVSLFRTDSLELHFALINYITFFFFFLNIPFIFPCRASKLRFFKKLNFYFILTHYGCRQYSY